MKRYKTVWGSDGSRNEGPGEEDMAKNTSIVSGLGFAASFFIALFRAVERLGGTIEDVYNALKDGSPLIDKWAGDIVEAGRKARNIIRLVLPSALTLPPWAKEVAENHEEPFAGKDVELELIEFCSAGESCVNGEEMLKRSLAKTFPAGNRTFERLATHPELVPEEWQKFVLIFPGTVLLDEYSNRHVQCLIFHVGQWYRNDYWLSSYFNSCCRVVGFRK